MVVAPDGLDPTEKRHLVYDAWNRLVEVRVDDAGDPGQPGALVVTYRYNGLGHRVTKLLGSDPENPASTIDYYYNAGWQVVEERVDGDVHTQYLWCPSYIDTPVLRWRDTSEVPNQTLNETLYYTVDANKNVTVLVDGTPGSFTEGQVVERYLYDPYGRVTVLDGDWNEIAWSASRRNEILFAGYRYNPETGYYQVRHREFNPLIGRWMQRDPLKYVDGGNLYEYARTDPTARLDSSGLESEKSKSIHRIIKGVQASYKIGRAIGDWASDNSNDEIAHSRGNATPVGFDLTYNTLDLLPYLTHFDRDKSHPNPPIPPEMSIYLVGNDGRIVRNSGKRRRVMLGNAIAFRLATHIRIDEKSGDRISNLWYYSEQIPRNDLSAYSQLTVGVGLPIALGCNRDHFSRYRLVVRVGDEINFGNFRRSCEMTVSITVSVWIQGIHGALVHRVDIQNEGRPDERNSRYQTGDRGPTASDAGRWALASAPVHNRPILRQTFSRTFRCVD